MILSQLVQQVLGPRRLRTMWPEDQTQPTQAPKQARRALHSFELSPSPILVLLRLNSKRIEHDDTTRKYISRTAIEGYRDQETAVCSHCYYIVYLNQTMVIQRKRLRWKLPRIFVGYRCRLAGDESLDPHISNRQVSCINTENIRHKTFHSFLLCIFFFHFKHVCYNFYILNYYSTYL